MIGHGEVRRAVGAFVVMIALIPLTLTFLIASGVPANPLELASWLYNVVVLMIVDGLVGGPLLAVGLYLLGDDV